MTTQTMVDVVDEDGRRLVLESTPGIDKLIGKLGELGVDEIHWLFLDTEIWSEVLLREWTLARGVSPSLRRSRQIERVSDSLGADLFDELQAAICKSEFGTSDWGSDVTVCPNPGRKRSRIVTCTTGLITDVCGHFWDVVSTTP